MKHAAIHQLIIVALCLVVQEATACQLTSETTNPLQLQAPIQEPSKVSDSQSPAAGFITFAVNAHDWRFVEDSGETLLRLVGLFEKLRIRGDFYVTAPLIERYTEKRPDVIARLKQSGMTISYHVRAPHPLWRGFSGPLRDKSANEIATVLRNYESYQLDLKNGDLNRSRAGGYRYVEQVFGRKPVAVGTSDAAPDVKAIASRVYADLGARMGVYYHESGTRIDQPFEFRDGLLVRPSDFSVTRFESPQNSNGIFWWNMVGTQKSAEFDPLALLQKKFAAWSGNRAPFITVLIHENDFYRQGGPGWNSIYFEGEGQQARPRRAPFDLETPPGSRPRPQEVREAIFAKYEELLTYAVKHLKVVTSEDIVAMAGADRSGISTNVPGPLPRQGLPPVGPLPRLNQNPNAPGASQVPRERVFLRIASPACGSDGIAVGVLVPKQPRFAEGAPVVINVIGGVQAGSAQNRPEYVGHGFVELHFAFPGGGIGKERSGGTYDFRGPNSIRALADVIRFATGHTTDTQGRKISDLAAGMKVLTNNVGILGSSHGGNACGLAMAKHGKEFPNLAWYASMESPYGEGAVNVEFGGHESGVNPAYNSKTGELDLSRLAWSDTASPGIFRRSMIVSTSEMRGAFYFDLNGDGQFTPENDFPANTFVGDAGNGIRAWYSPRILREAEKRKLISGNRPAHIPTLEEAQKFWEWRDAAPSIEVAVRRCPNAAVIVYANARDHVQADPAHTHILIQVEGFRKAGARFVRLNPDLAYVDLILSAGPRLRQEMRFADNPAGKIWNRTNITEGLEPSALPPGVYMQAAVCELADRSHAGNWSANLDAVLFPRH